MRRMTEPSPPDVLALARDLRPALFGSGSAGRISNPVVEPLWTGVRVIAAATGDDAVLCLDGDDVEGHHEVVSALARVIADTADSAILDAFLTKQAVVADTIIYTGSRADDLPSTRRLVVDSMVGTRPNRARDASERLEADVEAKTFRDGDPVNLVVIDLLWLDGDGCSTSPLLERKRLLEAIVPGDDLVRASPYVRPPIDTWIGSWRAQGFPGLSFKLGQLAVSPGQTAPRLGHHPDAPSLTGSATRVARWGLVRSPRA